MMIVGKKIHINSNKVYIRYICCIAPSSKEKTSYHIKNRGYVIKASINSDTTINKSLITNWWKYMMESMAWVSGLLAKRALIGEKTHGSEQKLILSQHLNIFSKGLNYYKDKTSMQLLGETLTNTLHFNEKNKILLSLNDLTPDILDINNSLPIEKDIINDFISDNDFDNNNQYTTLMIRLDKFTKNKVKIRLKSIYKRAKRLQRYIFITLVYHTNNLSNLIVSLKEDVDIKPMDDIQKLWDSSSFVLRKLEIAKSKGEDKVYFKAIKERIDILCSLNTISTVNNKEDDLKKDDKIDDDEDNLNLKRSFTAMPAPKLKFSTSSPTYNPKDILNKTPKKSTNRRDSTNSLQLSRSLTDMPSNFLTPKRSKHKQIPSTPTSPEVWTSDRNIINSARKVKNLKTLIKAQKKRTLRFNEENKNDITSELIMFITDRSEVIDTITDALQLQYQRAIGRWRALEYFYKLSQYLSQPELIINVLYPLAKSFSNLLNQDDKQEESKLEINNDDIDNITDNNRHSTMSHFLTNLDGAPKQVRDAIAAKYFDIIGNLIKKLKQLDEEGKKQQIQQEQNKSKAIFHMYISDGILNVYDASLMNNSHLHPPIDGINVSSLNITDSSISSELITSNNNKVDIWELKDNTKAYPFNVLQLLNQDNDPFAIEISIIFNSFIKESARIISSPHLFNTNIEWELNITSKGPKFIVKYENGNVTETSLPTDERFKIII